MIDDGLYRVLGTYAEARPGAWLAVNLTPAMWLELGAAIPHVRAVLFARDNANARFALTVRAAVGDALQEAALVVHGTAIAADGCGSENGVPTTLSFELDADQASDATALFCIVRQDRRPTAEQVVGAFSPSKTVYAVGEVVEIVLTLSNPAGAPEVLRWKGGRQRGPRDNQFSFTVMRDGKRVAPMDGFDLGGVATMTPFAARTSIELRAALDRWADTSVAGRYAVVCRYETRFNPRGARPHEDGQRGAVWDRVFEGDVVFDVR